jgi:hypothetical protein
MAIDPYTALTIGKGIVGFMEARREHQRIEAEYTRNWQESAKARDDSVQALNKRAIQEAEAAAGRDFELQIAAMQESESRKVVSAESGLTGQTEGLKVSDVEARKLRAQDVISGNLAMTLDQIDDEIIGVNTNMKNRINSMPRGQKPNVMAHAIGTAANAYSAEADITGKNLFTGQAIAKTKPNYVIPKTTGYSGSQWMGNFGALDLDF